MSHGRRSALGHPARHVDGRAVPPPVAPPFILFAGRHVPDKQVTAIPPALALARAHIPNLRAVFAGDGPLRGALDLLVSELRLRDAVAVTGFVSAERLGELMGSASCVV